jgi:dienelactone hydrolase
VNRHPVSRRLLLVVPAIAALSLLSLATVACGGSTSASGTDPRTAGESGAATTGTDAGRPHAFVRRTVTLVDRSRPTEAGSQTPALPERTLPTDAYVPEGTGPFPLIVFAHGLSGHPDKFTKLLSVWARAGYVVVAPAFPLTNDKVPGSDGNWQGLYAQPGDISFVLDSVLGTGGDQDGMATLTGQLPGGDGGPPLADRVDHARIGIGGLSLGGATTYGVAFNTCCRDDRFKAAEVLSGAQLPVGVPPHGDLRLDGHLPLLIVHGDHDGAFAYRLPNEIFAAASPPVWFVTFLGGTHAPPFENADSRWDTVAEQVTTDFWDATIGGLPDAMSRFEEHAVVPGLSTLQSKPG